ncbi:MAG: cyclic nucleotide-binding domain-containing protein [Dehalococcoidia bacterium]|nr:cyclic nucleotide-binding domain-containing protein [Dehalococcoidia bacterium]
MSTEDTLASVELFRDIEKNDLETLAKIVVERDFKQGDVIVKEGEPGLAMYIISRGKAEVVKGAGGSEQVIATLGAGDFFGEMALFDDSPRFASVRAVEDTDCLVMSKWDLKTAFVATDGRVAMALLAVLARRVRSLSDAATH